MELISVIVPIYNVEKYLPRCIESIINQTYKNLEIILIDDESPDNCGQICDEYAKKDSRIKVIHKKNGGVSSARNAGLDISQGDYIGFVDPDDYISEEMYEVMLTEAKKDDLGIVECNYFVSYEDGTCLVIDKRGKRLYNTFNDILYGVFTNYLYPGICFKLFKKTVINSIRFSTEFKIAEDMLFFLDCAKNNTKLKIISNPLYYYFQRQSSVMNRPFHNGAFDELKVVEMLKRICNNKKLINAYNSFYFPKLILVSQKIINTGKFSDRFDEIRKKILENRIDILRFKEFQEDGKRHSIGKLNKLYVFLLCVCPVFICWFYPKYLKFRRKGKGQK